MRRMDRPVPSRRSFLAAGLCAAPLLAAPSQTAIPRWRGFNLLDLFQAFSRKPELTSDDELRWIRDWGFNFIRIPMDYWSWIDGDWSTTRQMRIDDIMKIKEPTLEKVDRLVDLGRRFGLHVSLNFHRAPGYCINNADREPFVLWSDSRAEDAFIAHWEIFAKRYRGVSEFDLSFNLLNEAPKPRDGYMRREDYTRVMRKATERIRQVSPSRLVIVDGLDVGNVVADELIPLGVAQSVHAYWPGQISHYRASWVDKESKFPEPAWPVLNPDGSVKMGPEQLAARYAPWGELARRGIGVHCGECGCYNRTPHRVFLAWFEDVMRALDEHGIGYALWNFRGSFGLMDSGRADVEYEDWRGRKLDRKLLAVMQKY
jgi:aryl-phospho-beta-D-glucosidase BglC (GH1 family)